VSGSTLTLVTGKAATITAAASPLTKGNFITDAALVLDDSTVDSMFRDIDLHGAKCGVLLDTAYGYTVTGQTGYAIGGHNVWLRNTLTGSSNYAGTFLAALVDLRVEQATKHNVRIDQGVRDAEVRVRARSVRHPGRHGRWLVQRLQRRDGMRRQRCRVQGRRRAEHQRRVCVWPELRA
jgi:hypothetical protein